MTETQAPKACSTWSYRRRHLTMSFGPGARTLCGERVYVFNEGDPLPACKRCAQKAAKL